MTHLIVRRLLVDMEAPIERHWCDGDPFRTALFNALSMSFPVGEQFFIDSVRNGLRTLEPGHQQGWQVEVQGFIGQEATHRRLHTLYNAHLERQGLTNHWEARARNRLRLLEGVDVRHWLAITAANEHFTAVLAEWLLANASVLGERDRRLATLWLWHSAEESEHKSTAFDLYRALGGNEAWRRRWFWRISWLFFADLANQTCSNLRQDGTLWRWRTWASAGRWLLGRQGLLRQTFAPWKAYLRPDFHPREQDSGASGRWLADHQDSFATVGH